MVYLYMYIILPSSIFFKKKYLKFHLIFILVILSGFYLNGYDWIAYQYEYDYIVKKIPVLEINDILNYKREKLFYITMSIFKSLGITFNIFRMFVGAFIFVELYKEIRYYTKYKRWLEKNKLLIIYILFLFTYFILIEPVMRQGIAIIFALKAVRHINLKTFLYGIVAFGFHKTSIIFIFVNIFLKKRKKEFEFKYIILLLLLSIVILIFYLKISKYIIDFPIIGTYSKNYIINVKPNLRISMIKLFLELYILRSIYLFVLQKKSKDKFLIKFYNAYYIYIFLLSIGLYIPIFNRILLYFIIIKIVIYVYFIKDKIKDKINYKKLLLILFYLYMQHPYHRIYLSREKNYYREYKYTSIFFSNTTTKLKNKIKIYRKGIKDEI